LLSPLSSQSSETFNWLGNAIFTLDRWLGQRQGQAVQISLAELARHVAENDELDSVVAVRADMRLGTAEQRAQLIRMAAHYSFEAVPFETNQDGALHRFGEHIYLLLLVLATNPNAARASVLRREHTLVFLSRMALKRYCNRMKLSQRKEQ
jgi:hypothetical protein